MKKIIGVFLAAFVLCLLLANTNVQASNLQGGQIVKKLHVGKTNYLGVDLELARYEEFFEKIFQKEQFGGCYWEENGKLIIQYSDVPDDIEQIVSEYGMEGIVSLEKCKWKYRELTEVQDMLIDFCKKNTDKDDNGYEIVKNITSTNISEKENAVEVFLQDISDSAIDALFTAIGKNDRIIVKQGGQCKNASVNLNPGQAIRVNNVAGSVQLSAGFRCRKLSSTGSYIYGFVTAGHDNRINDDVKMGPYNVGVVFSRMYAGSVDASFVRITNANIVCTNTMNYSPYTVLTTNAYVNSFAYPFGPDIHIQGSSSHHIISSLVGSSASTNTVNADGSIDIFTNLVKVDESALPGDSGGIAYITAGSNCVVGIVKGTDTNGFTYIVKYTEIRDALGISLY